VHRQSLFEDPSFRAHLLWVTTGSTGALLFVLSAAVLIPLFQRFDNAASLDELRSVTQQILDLHARLWPVVFASLVSVFLSSWLLYRRMVAPLVRFVRAFDDVRRGQLPEPITLRASDYLRREAEALNAMLAALRAREAELASLRERVERGA
jgi:nitrogen fixation/metabolism regulation signal transduction histidine kinase